MSKQTKAIARKVFEDIPSQGNLALVDELVTGDYVGHPPFDDIREPQGPKQFFPILREAFPCPFAMKDAVVRYLGK